MRHQQASAIALNAARLPGHCEIHHWHAQRPRHAQGNLAILKVQLLVTPAIEIQGDDVLVPGTIVDKQRTTIARPQVFGGHMPQFNGIRQHAAGRGVMAVGGQHHHRLKLCDHVGNARHSPLQQFEEHLVGIDPAADRPLHERPQMGCRLVRYMPAARARGPRRRAPDCCHTAQPRQK